MGKDYVPKKSKYNLPGTVYLRTLWTIRDYDRLKASLTDQSLLRAVSFTSPGSGHKAASDPTAALAIRNATDKNRQIVDAVETALEHLPVEYRKGVWQSVQTKKAFPLDADRSTYGCYKSRFIAEVAYRLGYL